MPSPALSASGPAFVYIIIESFVEAGVKVGLPREVATLLAAQMVLGAASMVLRDRRTSGEAEGYRHDTGRLHDRRNSRTRRWRSCASTLIKAVVRATQRAKELVNG